MCTADDRLYGQSRRAGICVAAGKLDTTDDADGFRRFRWAGGARTVCRRKRYYCHYCYMRSSADANGYRRDNATVSENERNRKGKRAPTSVRGGKKKKTIFHSSSDVFIYVLLLGFGFFSRFSSPISRKINRLGKSSLRRLYTTAATSGLYFIGQKRISDDDGLRSRTFIARTSAARQYVATVRPFRPIHNDSSIASVRAHAIRPRAHLLSNSSRRFQLRVRCYR